MRIVLIRLVFLIIVSIFGLKGLAQVNIDIKDVLKIHLIDGAGYLGGYYQNDYDLVLENGQWKCYQTHEKFRRSDFRQPDPKKFWLIRDSIEHTFIKVVDKESINMLLKTLNTIKPKFSPSDLNISIPKLTEKVDTGYLKYLDEKKIQIFNSFFNTPAKLNHLLDTLQYDYWTDDNPYCVLEILKKGGDTIKVVTDRQVNYMLPWRVNEIPTYDISINNFFITTTGLKNHRMSGKYLSGRVYSWIDFFYAQDAFERLRWKEVAAENVDFINQHFNILNISRYNDYSSYSFNSKNLNNHIIINGILNITNKPQLIALTKFTEDTVRKFLKAGGFMIDSCLAKPGCTVNFGNNNGQASHHYFSILQKNLDLYLKQYPQQSLWVFTIKAGKRVEDNWVALPDGKFVLTAYLDDYAVGVSPAYIKNDGMQQRKFVFKIFDRDGKLIYEGN